MIWTQGGGGEERSHSDDVAEGDGDPERVTRLRHDLDDLEVKVDKLEDEVEAIREERRNVEEE